MPATHIRVNPDGSILLPDALRQRFGLREGSMLIAAESAEGILLRPADLMEMYTPERKAEFLLGNATTPEEYAETVAEVRRMGLDPDRIDHFRPASCDRG